MRCSRGMQIHVACREFEFAFVAIVLDNDFYAALELVEKFFGFVVMVIFPGVGPSNDHYDIIVAIRVDILVSDGRLEQMAIFIDPFIEIERFRDSHDKMIYANLQIKKAGSADLILLFFYQININGEVVAETRFRLGIP